MPDQPVSQLLDLIVTFFVLFCVTQLLTVITVTSLQRYFAPSVKVKARRRPRRRVLRGRYRRRRLCRDRSRTPSPVSRTPSPGRNRPAQQCRHSPPRPTCRSCTQLNRAVPAVRQCCPLHNRADLAPSFADWARGRLNRTSPASPEVPFVGRQPEAPPTYTEAMEIDRSAQPSPVNPLRNLSSPVQPVDPDVWSSPVFLATMDNIYTLESSDSDAI